MAYFSDLSALVAGLRKDGLDARNLGQVGITVWDDEQGFFFPACELEENAELVARRDFIAIVAKRNASSSRIRLAS